MPRLDSQLLLGVAGLTLMLAGTLGYSWRKQPRHTGPGSMQAWLRFHVLAGLFGPALILLHGGISRRCLAGATLWIMFAVVASGIVGRVVFTRTGRTQARHRLSAWWLLHVPGAAVLFVLALIHALAALYYATFQR